MPWMVGPVKQGVAKGRRRRRQGAGRPGGEGRRQLLCRGAVRWWCPAQPCSRAWRPPPCPLPVRRECRPWLPLTRAVHRQLPRSSPFFPAPWQQGGARRQATAVAAVTTAAPITTAMRLRPPPPPPLWPTAGARHSQPARGGARPSSTGAAGACPPLPAAAARPWLTHVGGAKGQTRCVAVGRARKKVPPGGWARPRRRQRAPCLDAVVLSGGWRPRSRPREPTPDGRPARLSPLPTQLGGRGGPSSVRRAWLSSTRQTTTKADGVACAVAPPLTRDHIGRLAFLLRQSNERSASEVTRRVAGYEHDVQTLLKTFS